MVFAVLTGRLWRAVRSLDGCFDRPKSHGTLCWGRAVKQMGKCAVSFWSVGGNLAKSLTDLRFDVDE